MLGIVCVLWVQQWITTVKYGRGTCTDVAYSQGAKTDNKQKKLNVHRYLGFPGGSVVKNSPASAGDTGDASLIPGSGRCSGGRNGNPVQYSCPGNSMAREAWQAAVHGVTWSQTRLSNGAQRHTVYILRTAWVVWCAMWGLRRGWYDRKSPKESYTSQRDGQRRPLKEHWANSWLALCDPMDCSLPGSSICGIFQARVLEWVAISFSRGREGKGDNK